MEPPSKTTFRSVERFLADSGMFDRIRKLLSLSLGRRRDDAELEALQQEFQNKVQSFHRLITANNDVLKCMTELEAALAEQRPAGRAFIRSRTHRIADSVSRVIQNLEEISGGRYTALSERFQMIQAQLSLLIGGPDIAVETPLVIPLSEASLEMADRVGGKMGALGELGAIPGVRIPVGYVVTTKSYRRFVEESGIQKKVNRLILSREAEGRDPRGGMYEEIGQLVMDADLPVDLELEILEHYDRLNADGGRRRMAVRSSAIREDDRRMSYAGQYRTMLHVDRDGLVQAYKQVLASKYSVHAMSYRMRYGIPDDEVPMSVGFMPMVRARSGGVVYSANPLDSEDDSIFIYAAKGLPHQVVDGSGDVETFVLARGPSLQIQEADRARLEDVQLPLESAVGLARLALKAEEHFGAPQDIEWALGPEGIVLLQSRALTRRVIRDGHGDRTRERRPDDILHTGGVTASRGFGTGTAFIAQSPGDAGHFPKGAVLVAAQPLPFWATLLRNASALVIEQGGVACHLANVAREFDVPALFGVEGARQKLPEGGVISVDANHRKIYRGAIEDPLADAIVPRSSNTSSEVFDTLKKVAKLIVPLNLVDSEDPHFRAERCETFHDITRFCHEKSVEEMFGFGAEHHFPARASRRLFKEVPTQFWIVDLGDGLREPATDPRFVRFDNIASIPMLAVWRGMDAFEWDGPPPVDPKGFFQLLASSAMDRHLNISVPSRYASGNHFMISRNYCSLQTRFGYHFATVEALVGDSAMENYVRLLFSGGGAGQERKNRRARLIAEVLEHKGFQTTRSRDTVEARLGGYGQPRMEAALEVLGYLLVHTRQLDMVMKDNMSFDRYKSKILTDLDNL